MSGSAHVTNGGSGDEVDWNCLTHVFPSPNFGMQLLERESNGTFVKR